MYGHRWCSLSVALSTLLLLGVAGCIEDPDDMEAPQPPDQNSWTDGGADTSCGDDQTACNQGEEPVCVDLHSDDDHCGDCSNRCETDVSGASASCIDGRCVVECSDDDQRLCDDGQQTCVDTTARADHCGRCATECTSGDCSNGRCQPVDCDPNAELTATGGGGTDDPFAICSIPQLDELRDEPDAHVVLADDLVFEISDQADDDGDDDGDDSDGDDEQSDHREQFEPIDEFAGTFRGDGFEIRHVTNEDRGADQTGLFRRLDEDAEISDLTLADVDIRGDDETGALAGVSRGEIDNVVVDGGSVRGDGDNTGGLVGTNRGSITTSAVHDTEVEGHGDNTGGLAGRTKALIENSKVSAAVVGHDRRVGGLVGRMREEATVVDSGAAADVTGHERRIGGLVGDARDGSTITGCEATGDVTATGVHDDTVKTGGLVGRNRATLTDSLATGTVRAAGNRAGGLVGEYRDDDGCQVTDTYAAGDVVAAGAAHEFGGLIGRIDDDCPVDDSVATGDVVAPGVADTGGLVGLARHETTLEDTTARGDVEAGHRTGGLVGRTDHPDAEIERSRALGDVAGIDETGGLIGRLNGDVDTCWAGGDATGATRSGGLVGWMHGPGADVDQSFALGDATGADRVGGLVGDVNDPGAEISDSYALGDAAGVWGIGGLVGSLSGEVGRSYSAGLVVGDLETGGLVGHLDGDIEESYWDRQTSGRYDHGDETDAGEPLYTDQFDNRDGHFDSWPEVTWRIPTTEELPNLAGDRDDVRPHLRWEDLDED